MTLTTEVQAIDGSVLHVHGVFHRDYPEGYRFSLVFRNEQVVRRWDVNLHHNPDCVDTDGPHKHFWTTDARDAFAYPARDIPLGDVNVALMSFLKECNIKLRGKYTQVLAVSLTSPPQTRMRQTDTLEDFNEKVRRNS